MERKKNKRRLVVEMADGTSDIMKSVGNEEVSCNVLVGHKFQEPEGDVDGELSVKELESVVADICAALSLPVHGIISPDSDPIYSEVLNEFTNGEQQEVSKTEHKRVHSDILLGMAADLKRDPVVILRIDGDDLVKFLNSPSYEPEMLSILSNIESRDGSLQDCIVRVFEKLTVDHGMPPASDPWVMSSIIEPALQSCVRVPQQPLSQETVFTEFKKVAECVAQHLRDKPVIVAHCESTFDGSGIRRLLSNKFELDKTLDSVVKGLPRDRFGKLSKDFLRVGLDVIAISASLPPVGAVDQMDKIINEAIKMLDADDGNMVKEDEFKKLLTEILRSIMLQLEGKPISVSTNSVVHEPLTSSSTFLQPSYHNSAD